jgi:hypothetical protein
MPKGMMAKGKKNGDDLQPNDLCRQALKIVIFLFYHHLLK